MSEPLDLDHEVRAVLASKDPELGMTAERAEEIRDAIMDADRADDDSLIASDLLHNRAIFGRAF